jgi:hypothetical protein
MHAVDRYIESLPDEKQDLVQSLRRLILQVVPAIEERYSFRIPFYHYYGMFCYINPVKDGVDLALCRGKDLLEAFPQLESKGRAIVASLTIKNRKDLVRLEVAQILAAAALWNEEARKLKKPMVKERKRKMCD